MDNFCRDFQSLMRRFYLLLPVKLAFTLIGDCIVVLDDEGYIESEERNFLVLLNKAYSDLLGG